jgi:hypothetical protein
MSTCVGGGADRAIKEGSAQDLSETAR